MLKGVVSGVAVASALAVLVAGTPLGQGAVWAGERRANQSEAVVQTAAEAQFQEAIRLELQRDWASALDAARQAVALDPGTARYVDKEARLAGFLMLDTIASKDWTATNAFAQELLTLEQNWTGPKRLDPATTLRFGQAHFLTGDLAGAEQRLLAASKVGLLNSEAQVWLYAIYQSRGDTKAMKRLATKPWIIFRAFNPVYTAITE